MMTGVEGERGGSVQGWWRLPRASYIHDLLVLVYDVRRPTDASRPESSKAPSRAKQSTDGHTAVRLNKHGPVSEAAALIRLARPSQLVGCEVGE